MKINTKIFVGFVVLIASIFTQLAVWYTLQVNISENTRQISDIESPMVTLTERMVGYDALKTEQVYLALLDAQKENYSKIQIYKEKYDDTEMKLDSLLKKDSVILLNQSQRSQATKDTINGILKKADETNIILADLEAKAFQAIENHDPETAYSLIMGGYYRARKDEFQQNYRDWTFIEEELVLNTRDSIFNDSQRLVHLNLVFSVFIIIVLLSILRLVRPYITSYYLSNLR